MDQEKRAELIERYGDGYGVVAHALEGLSDKQLDRQDPGGGWSARQIVHHLADSEMTSAIRFRLLLCEESPRIHGYDEAEFARRLFYEQRPIAPAVAALKAARDTTAQIIGHLQDSDWQRAGYHSESGEYSLESWLEVYAVHCHDHAAQIERAAGAGSRPG